MTFSASWIMRGSPAVVIVPKPAAPSRVRLAERRRVQEVEDLGTDVDGGATAERHTPHIRAT